MQGDVAVVTSLLEQGFCPNVQDYAGWTPLVSIVISLSTVFTHAWWLSGRALDLQFTGHGFNSRPVRFHVT